MKNYGYRKVCDNKEIALFVKGALEICFYKNKDSKIIGINTDTGEQMFGNTIYACTEIEFEELKAINEKVKELGWEE